MYKIKLCSTNQEMVDAWKAEFKDYPRVDIIYGDIFKEHADAIVSPGNSFGLMDAGLDKLMTDYFGKELEQHVQKRIIDEFQGELLVGLAFILKTNNPHFPYFISSPTMRVPMRIEDTVNVYLSTRAIFISLEDFNNSEDTKIESVIIPGMGIGTGRMPYKLAAKQMRVAYERVFLKKQELPHDWRVAVAEHKDMIK